MKDRKVKIALSLGAGVQSSALSLMASRGEIGPMPDCAVFADTQDEPASVYEWLDYLTPLLAFPVHRVTAGKLSQSFLEMHVTSDGRRYSRTNVPVFTRNEDGSIGKIRMRGCTRDFKLVPIMKFIRDLVGKEGLLAWRREHRRAIAFVNDAKKLKLPPPMDAWNELQGDALVLQWIGISTDEVVRVKPSRVGWAKAVWPLIDANLSRRACLAWMKAAGFRTPPRSACVYCPYHSDKEWLRLQREEPAAFAEAVRVERTLQEAKKNSDNFKTVPFLHKTCVEIEKIDFAARIHAASNDPGQFNLFDDQFTEECEGMCGV